MERLKFSVPHETLKMIGSINNDPFVEIEAVCTDLATEITLEIVETRRRISLMVEQEQVELVYEDNITEISDDDLTRHNQFLQLAQILASKLQSKLALYAKHEIQSMNALSVDMLKIMTAPLIKKGMKESYISKLVALVIINRCATEISKQKNQFSLLNQTKPDSKCSQLTQIMEGIIDSLNDTSISLKNAAVSQQKILSKK